MRPFVDQCLIALLVEHNMFPSTELFAADENTNINNKYCVYFAMSLYSVLPGGHHGPQQKT
jgi:hypothetical protein